MKHLNVSACAEGGKRDAKKKKLDNAVIVHFITLIKT